ncbi:MAG TPA: hypothetical protein VEK73_05835 [Xanthobacteraceae bacterium]|nr:hypothetical protein [Xanthobacteraceae bacterium]
MYSLRACTTDDRQLLPPDLGAELTWDRLTEILRREIGPEAAALLAEPVADPGRGITHWHITAERDPEPLSALAPAERADLVRRLAAVRGRISSGAQEIEARGGEANVRLAAALRTIMQVPDEEAHVWSVAGQPVLTAWGRRSGSVARQAATIMVRAAPRAEPPPPVAGPVVRAAAPPASAPGGDVAPPRRGRWLPWRTPFLWALFVVLLGGIYYLLLAACALDIPVLRSVLNRCESGAQARDLDDLAERNRALREAIREAERRVALARSDCGPRPGERAQRVPEPPQQVPDTREATRTEEPPDARQAEERVREAEGTRGRLDVTLAWNGHADLDLHVRCPGGEISFDKPNVCGGKLDIDRNAPTGPLVDDPVEHVTWIGEPPPGQYRVEVVYYDGRDTAGGPVPFTVVIRDGNNEQVFKGVAQKPHTTVIAAEFRH